MDFICQDTGIKLQLRKVPFTLTEALMKQFEKTTPPPVPPKVTVDYGDGETIEEANEAHPAYIRRLANWQDRQTAWVNEQARHLFTELAIECEVDLAAVQTLRSTMRKVGVELDPDDKYVYVWNIAVGTTEGYGELLSALQRRSSPTSEGVNEAKASFRG